MQDKERQGTPLHFAVTKNDKELTVEAVRLLIADGANANITDSNGNTPLHLAVKYNFDDNYGAQIARILINAGARIDATNSEHKTPLDVLNDEDIVAPFQAPILFSLVGTGRSER